MRTLPALLLVVVTLILAACSAASPSQEPNVSVTTPEGAFALVRGSSPLFDGIEARDPDLIGQGSWYEAVPTTDATVPGGWDVTIEVGWGDCQAGCIDRHTWTWTVAADGAITLRSETGSPLADDVLAALLRDATGTGIGGRVLAGPTCPVEIPGDPACAPRAVSGATLVVTKDGTEVQGLTTDGSGFYRFAGLAPGSYTLVASAVEGFMGTPGPIEVTVTEGTMTLQDVIYDTGIR